MTRQPTRRPRIAPHPFYVNPLPPPEAPWHTWADSVDEAMRLARELTARHGCHAAVFDAEKSVNPDGSDPVVAEFAPQGEGDLGLLLRARAVAAGDEPATAEVLARARRLVAALAQFREVLAAGS